MPNKLKYMNILVKYKFVINICKILKVNFFIRSFKVFIFIRKLTFCIILYLCFKMYI